MTEQEPTLEDLQKRFPYVDLRTRAVALYQYFKDELLSGTSPEEMERRILDVLHSADVARQEQYELDTRTYLLLGLFGLVSRGPSSYQAYPGNDSLQTGWSVCKRHNFALSSKALAALENGHLPSEEKNRYQALVAEWKEARNDARQ
jgi:hypothetical protein